jgi:hypothetical protein
MTLCRFNENMANLNYMGGIVWIVRTAKGTAYSSTLCTANYTRNSIKRHLPTLLSPRRPGRMTPHPPVHNLSPSVRRASPPRPVRAKKKLPLPVVLLEMHRRSSWSMVGLLSLAQSCIGQDGLTIYIFLMLLKKFVSMLELIGTL